MPGHFVVGVCRPMMFGPDREAIQLQGLEVGLHGFLKLGLGFPFLAFSGKCNSLTGLYISQS